jgi:NADPH:quinone reductase-like Zn-dependent oxidoreductase
MSAMPSTPGRLPNPGDPAAEERGIHAGRRRAEQGGGAVYDAASRHPRAREALATPAAREPRAPSSAAPGRGRSGVIMSTPTMSHQFWTMAPGRGAIVEAPLAPRRPGEVLVRALFSGISRGSESLVFRGEVPPSQHQAMRAPFQEGEFPAPVKYGYASVGEVRDGAAADDLLGRTVFCLFPHQDVYCVPAGDVVPLPDGVPAERAILAANMESALTIAWDAGPLAGDRIVIIGAGVVGLLVAWLCRQTPGAAVTVVDVDPGREAAARALGVQLLHEPPLGADADLVIHASGHPDGLRSALQVAGVEGTIVEASWHGDHDVCLPLGEWFHSRRLTIRSSQVGRIPPGRAPRWSRVRRMSLALELLRAPELDTLITGESGFSELPEVMARLSHDSRAALCHRVRYESA